MTAPNSTSGRSRAALARLQLAVLCTMTLSCGGKTSTEDDQGIGPGSCVDGDGQERREGTRIACDCSTVSSGTSDCSNGAWSKCECVAPDETSGAGGRVGAAGAGTAAATCGNGRAEGPESCDGADLRGQACSTVTMGARPTGTLRCTPACTFDVSRCNAATR